MTENITMILLIGGATHTGKTLLAAKLIETYKYPCLSLDHLKMGLIRSGNTSLTPESDEQDLTACLWPIVREMIKTAVENNQNMIIEGCYIPYDWAGGFTGDYLEHIRYRCLVMSRNYILSHYADILKYACAIEQRMEDCCPAESLIRDNMRALEMCRLYGTEYILIEDRYHIPGDLFSI